MSYIGNTPGVSSQRIVDSFIATSNQTTFTTTSGYTPGYVDVYLNGVKLVASDDFTASTGSTIVLATGASAGDSVEIVAYLPRGLSDGYLKSEADARYLNLAGGTLTGGLGIGGAAESGSQIRTYNGSGHGKITIETTDSYASFINYSAATSEFSAGFVKSDSSFRFCAYGDLTTNERARIDSGGNFTVWKGAYIGVENPGTGRVGKLFTDGTGTQLTAHNGSGEPLTLNSPTGLIYFYTGGSERARITSGGNFGVGTLSPSAAVHAKGTTIPIICQSTSTGAGPNYLKFTDTASTDLGYVGYGSSSKEFYITNYGADPIVFYSGAERARFLSSGILRLALSQLQLSGGDVGIVVANGSANINSTYSVTFNAASQSSLFVFAAHNHYGLIAGYGCSRLSACSVGPGGGSENNIHNATTGNGGSWTFSPGTSSITVTHNAGSYGAGGLYTIIVIGNGVSV